MYLKNWPKTLSRPLTVLLTLVLVFTLSPISSFGNITTDTAYASDFSTASNGAGFQKVDDGVGVVFTGGNSNNCLGFRGTYLTLSKSDLTNVKSNTTANAALGKTDTEDLYLDGVTYSGIDKKGTHQSQVKGINLKTLKSIMGITSTPTSIFVKSTDNFTRTVPTPFGTKYCFYKEDGTTKGAIVDPALSLEETGTSDIPRFLLGQESENDFNMTYWVKTSNFLNFGKPTASLSLNNNGETKGYYLGDIIRSTAGQYKATFNYTKAGANVSADITGIPLAEFLREEGLNPDEMNITANTSSKNVNLKSIDINKYFIAYDGQTTTNGANPVKISNNTDLQIYGPGSTEDEVCIKDVTGLTLTAAAPNAPSSVTASKKTYNSITVNWAAVSNATNYYVYRYDNKTKQYDEVYDTYKGGSKTSFIDTNLKTGTTYTYKVKAYRVLKNAEILSDYSIGATAKPILNKTTLKSVKKSGKKAVSIKWKKVSGANGYVIYKATKKKGKYKKAAIIKKGTKTTYKDKKVKKGKKYFYKIKAYRTVDGIKVYSSYSKIKSVKR